MPLLQVAVLVLCECATQQQEIQRWQCSLVLEKILCRMGDFGPVNWTDENKQVRYNCRVDATAVAEDATVL
jgi:hypothetical protein